MFAMQRIDSQGENEKKETLALQSALLTLLLYGNINEIEQTKWDFSLVIFLFAYVIKSSPSSPFPIFMHKHLPKPLPPPLLPSSVMT